MQPDDDMLRSPATELPAKFAPLGLTYDDVLLVQAVLVGLHGRHGRRPPFRFGSRSPDTPLAGRGRDRTRS